MNEECSTNSSNVPDVGAATAKIVELFERGLAEREDLKKWIEELSSKANPTIRDRLCLALYRHQLSFREPPLPSGDPLTGATLWEYWASHPTEYRKYCRLETEIQSYLEPPETRLSRAKSIRQGMIDLIQQDSVTFLAYYPVIEKMFGKPETKAGPGAPVTRRLPAVRAVQMQIDNDWNLKRVTKELCDCGNDHSQYCEQRMRQSIISLKKLLHKCKVEPPRP